MTTQDVTWTSRDPLCPVRLTSRRSVPFLSSPSSTGSPGTTGRAVGKQRSSSCPSRAASFCSSSLRSAGRTNPTNRKRRSSSTSSSFPPSCPVMTSLPADCAVLRAYQGALCLQEELRAQYETSKRLSLLRRYASLRRLVRAATAEPRLHALRAGARSSCTCGRRAGPGEAMRAVMVDLNDVFNMVLRSAAGFVVSSRLDSSSPTRGKQRPEVCFRSTDHDWQRGRLVLLATQLDRVKDCLTSARLPLARYTAIKTGLKHVLTARLTW